MNTMDMNGMYRALQGNRAVQAAANSTEAQKLLRSLDGTDLAEAVRKGDTAALQGCLSRVLATPEGRALAQKLREAVRSDG